MPNQLNTYGDISPRTAAYATKKLLKRGSELMVLEKFGQFDPQGKNKTKTRKWRRYNSLPMATAPLAEGVSPQGQKLTYSDVEAVLEQYGDLVNLTDVIVDTHEDAVPEETTDLISEQSTETVETIRFNRLKAGSNVFYANGVTARTSVDSPPLVADFRKMFRHLRNNRCKKITKIIKAGHLIATEPIMPAYISLVHTNLVADIRALPGFISVEKYSNSMKAMDGEIGSFEDFRFLSTSMFNPWLAAGASGTTYLSNGTEVSAAASCDVFPILVFGQDAYAIVPLKGKNAIKIAALNPGVPRSDDPLGQRGFVSWKTMQACQILNENWLCRYECAASANPNA